MENQQEQPTKNLNDNKTSPGHQVTSVTTTTTTTISSPPPPPSSGQANGRMKLLRTILGLIIPALTFWYSVDPTFGGLRLPKNNPKPSPTLQTGKKQNSSSPVIPAAPPKMVYVNTNNVNMVAVPGDYSQVLLVLSRGDSAEYLETLALGEETWVRVHVQTNVGGRTGWINKRYISGKI